MPNLPSVSLKKRSYLRGLASPGALLGDRAQFQPVSNTAARKLKVGRNRGNALEPHAAGTLRSHI